MARNPRHAQAYVSLRLWRGFVTVDVEGLFWLAALLGRHWAA